MIKPNLKKTIILTPTRSIIAKEYITTHCSGTRFDLIELLKDLQPNPNDRDLVEQEIKDAVKEILDENPASSLKNLASAIAISQFRVSFEYVFVCLNNFY